ncbi:MAG TPA: type II toxin-antitoxin system VapC family toxin [Rectinemataceae bacterium]|nr:type II toxin-antitoxin system VapC family toxin [Rectinemataceae bacterium]
MTSTAFSPPPGASILLDSSPLIYLVEGSPLRRRAVERFLAYAADRGLRLVASTLIWTELLHKPLASGETALADRYRSLLADSDRLALAPVDVAIAEEAARLRTLRRLQLADAIHLATALVLRVDAILGNDERWKLVPECPRLILVDELAFEVPEP